MQMQMFFLFIAYVVHIVGSKPVLVPQPTRSSSESICSRPGSSIPSSPGHTIYVSASLHHSVNIFTQKY